MPGSGDEEVGLGDGLWRIDLVNEVGAFVVFVLVAVDWAIEADRVALLVVFGGFGFDDVEGAPGDLG